MATNFIKPGNTVTVIAGGAITSGQVVILGTQLIGIAQTSAAASGDEYEAALEGVFDLAANDADVWAMGDRLFWDPGASELIDDGLNTGDVFIGHAMEAKAATTSALALVRLSPSFEPVTA